MSIEQSSIDKLVGFLTGGLNKGDYEYLVNFFGMLGEFGFVNEDFPGVPMVYAMVNGYTEKDVPYFYASGMEVPYQWAPRFYSEEERQAYAAKAKEWVIFCSEEEILTRLPKVSKPDTPEMAAMRTRQANNSVAAVLKTATQLEAIRGTDYKEKMIGDHLQLFGLSRDTLDPTPQPDPPVNIPKDAWLCTKMHPEGQEWPRVQTEYPDFTPQQFRGVARLATMLRAVMNGSSSPSLNGVETIQIGADMPSNINVVDYVIDLTGDYKRGVPTVLGGGWDPNRGYVPLARPEKYGKLIASFFKINEDFYNSKLDLLRDLVTAPEKRDDGTVWVRVAPESMDWFKTIIDSVPEEVASWEGMAYANGDGGEEIQFRTQIVGPHGLIGFTEGG